MVEETIAMSSPEAAASETAHTVELEAGEEMVWRGKPSNWRNLAYFLMWSPTCIVLIGFFVIGWRWLRTKTTVFEITTERLVVTRGIFNRETDDCELYRVRDYKIAKPFWVRVVGLGNLTVFTTDKSDPIIQMRGLQDVERIQKLLRDQVETRRRAVRMRGVEMAANVDIDDEGELDPLGNQ